MGCCCSNPNQEPKEEATSVIWRVSQVYGSRKASDSFRTRFSYAGGVVYVNDKGWLCYDARCFGRLRIPLNEIREVKIDTAFREPHRYASPCYCGCSGCGDGMVDIVGSIAEQKLEFHIGFCAVNHKRMSEELQDIVNAAKFR